ncbi:MAG: 2-C-methyl-D-erythritol 4-phosphate cytidylyltransferase [Halioglobus sp.]|jgi:2-C-methyl-D-erythritol 4-phosphate cytidylyltransferase
MSKKKPQCWAVIPAAGTGSRMGGDLPKQYLEVAGATLLEHSLQALLGTDAIQSVVVALHSHDDRAATLPVFENARVQTTIGAEQRSGSVLAGLKILLEIAAPDDWVLVHDAARPCLQREDLTRLINTVTASGTGGILAERIVDTVKQSCAESMVTATLDRSQLWRAQTPQMFRLEELHTALSQALAEDRDVTDEASAMEMAGRDVQLVAGARSNLKVTVVDDLPLAAWYLQPSSGSNGE